MATVMADYPQRVHSPIYHTPGNTFKVPLTAPQPYGYHQHPMGPADRLHDAVRF